jgi:hypothetical protein
MGMSNALPHFVLTWTTYATTKVEELGFKPPISPLDPKPVAEVGSTTGAIPF